MFPWLRLIRVWFDVIAESRVEFSSLASNKGLRLDIEPCRQCVRSDPSLVEQILRNLVSNAIKYTQKGWVRLRCRRWRDVHASSHGFHNGNRRHPSVSAHGRQRPPLHCSAAN